MALTDYLSKRKITIDSTKIDSTLTNYPVMLKLYYDSSVSAWSGAASYIVGDIVKNNGAYFRCITASTSKEPRVDTSWQDDWIWLGDEFDFSKIQSDAKDIRFTASDESTILDYERELIETTTQPYQLVIHVRIPSVSSSADTDYYMYYNYPSETVDGENKTGVWDEHFCYDKYTEVLTDEGWKLFKDLNREEKVATLNPDTGELEYHKPYDYIQYNYNGEMINVVDSQQIDLSVIPDHNMYVSIKGKKWKNFELVKAKDVFDKRTRYKKDAKWIGIEKKYFILSSVNHDYSTTNQYKKGIIKHKKQSEIKIPMDLWIEFLGYYISEGCVYYNDKGKKHQYNVNISQSKIINKENYKKIEKLLGLLPFKYSDTKTGFNIYNKQLAKYLLEFGKSQDKFIPKDILNLSSRQLKILFDALMLGDGNSKGTAYYTTSKLLADQFQELLLKIGFAGNIRKQERNKKNDKWLDLYTISVLDPNRRYSQINPIIWNKSSDGTKARYEKSEYNDMVYSVNVKNHILYVRRNGKTCWSGNCLVQHMGSSLLDSTSNGNDGINNGTTVIDGLNGKARNFDGIDDYISIDGVTTSDDITITMFCKQQTITLSLTDQPYFVDSSSGRFMFYYDNGNLAIFDGDNNISSLSIVDNNALHMIGLSQSSTTAKLFMDSNNETLTTNGLSIGGAVNIGARYDDTRTNVIGAVDEVRISNIARSDAWIKADYNNLKTWELQSIGEEINLPTQYYYNLTQFNKMGFNTSDFPISEYQKYYIQASIELTNTVNIEYSPPFDADVYVEVEIVGERFSPALNFDKKNDYLKYLQQNIREPIVKIELLRQEDETVYGVITDKLENGSGSLNISNANGTRRSTSFVLINNDNRFIDLVTKNTFNKKFKLSLGFLIDDEEIWFPQGVFLFDNPMATSSFSSKTVTISGSDKFGQLNGTHGGVLDGYYQIPAGTTISSAIRDYILPLDIVKDVKRANIDPDLESITTPYSIEKEWGDTMGSIILELAGMVSANVYYDVNGVLTFEKDVPDTLRGSKYDFSTSNDFNYLGGSKTSLINEIYNGVLIVGDNIDGQIYDYLALNNDIADPTSYTNTGIKKILKFEDEFTSLIDSDAKARIRAEYELRRIKRLQSEVALQSLPMYHLDIDNVITLTDEYLDSSQERLLINNMTIPLNTSGTMTIKAGRVS